MRTFATRAVRISTRTSAQRLLLAVACLLPAVAMAQTSYYEKNFEVTNPDNTAGTPSNVAYSKTVNAAIYPVINSVKMKLMVENPFFIPLRVKLMNERGETVYTTKLARNERVHMHKFDMTNMPDGSYSVEVSDGVNALPPLEFRVQSRKPVVTPERVVALN